MSNVPLTDARVERARLAQLHDYRILDTATDRRFDDFADLAAQLCDTPIALISLVDADRQWFKARVGLDVCQISRDASFCAHAMYGDEVMQIRDARVDPRFAGNPLVVGEPRIRFYAGAPLIAASGHRLGTLCVIDRTPRLLTTAQRRGLLALARQVVDALELRRATTVMREINDRLRDADRLKDEFLARITHELRTPLTSIHGFLEVLDDEDLPAASTARFMGAIRRNSDRLLQLVDDMLLAAEFHAGTMKLDLRPVDVAALARATVTRNRSAAVANGLTLVADAPTAITATADAGRLGQALDRLVRNAIKFTTTGGVVVRADTVGGCPVIEVSDTGTGIAAEEQSRLFAPFRRTRDAEHTEVQGVGLGLTIVKAIVDGHHGVARIDSAPGAGTTVRLTLPAPAAAVPAP